MNILIAHERFLFRFGVDRVMIELINQFNQLGHSITLITYRIILPAIQSLTNKINIIPVINKTNLEQNSLDYLTSNWTKISINQYDVVLIGGWPFCSSIPFFKSQGLLVVVSDHGIPNEDVPFFNYYRVLRDTYFNYSDKIIGVSQYVSKQLDHSNYSVIHNGGDHLRTPFWKKRDLPMFLPVIPYLSYLSRQHKILLLGRWNITNYKNSDSIFRILSHLLKITKDFVIFVCEDKRKINIPIEFQPYLIPIGYPDDEELLTLIRSVDVGLSVSLWEGFNLPLLETQWEHKPVMCFNKGAHPEIVQNTNSLCSSEQELVDKLLHLDLLSIPRSNWTSMFIWANTAQYYLDEIQR